MPDAAIAFRRMRNLLISGPKTETPADVVRRLGALQAQDYAQATWAIGLRTESATLADVERAIADRRIVLTWALRGTLHAVPAEDARWMVRLSAPRVLARDRRRQRQLEIDERLIAQCGRLIEGALKDRQRMTRAELTELLEQAGISTRQQRGYHILWMLAHAGLICPGPLEGRQQTFVLLEDWAPNPRELSGEEAMRELAIRYFTGHGPATLHDFCWWSELTVTEAKKAAADADGVLFCETIGGTAYWSGGDGADSEGPPDVALLAGYDEYLLGYKVAGPVSAVRPASAGGPASTDGPAPAAGVRPVSPLPDRSLKAASPNRSGTRTLLSHHYKNDIMLENMAGSAACASESPASCTTFGMPYTTHDSSASVSTRPPCAFTRRHPSSPSWPMPVSTTASIRFR
ncbi:hypothetical protein Theco_0432 [Thermobacillus composti KWC4]|uniref:Winged helix DNA-binding domain-containing protein n=1 Tax=Thermobacillus composti (strain DSM 18247 / JCM 13945 / KWC4) TaxID=717605 RepID=L0E8M6_THECK|nr:winged helix DNA-binding domain-containing protein [Thermobacillus composti]AGA56653.1 hypothetical protein Theco_0432 [Thermobacillus composti KWC4]